MVESDLRGLLGQIGAKTEAKTNSDKSGIEDAKMMRNRM